MGSLVEDYQRFLPEDGSPEDLVFNQNGQPLDAIPIVTSFGPY